MLSVYLHEASAVKLCNTVERIQKSHALSHLAWLVTSKLDCWFEWCHPEDTEARIVLLSPDQQTAMVMSRSMGPTRAYDPLSSIDMLIGGVPLAMHNHTDYLNWRGHAGSADELGAAKRDTLHRNALSASASVYRQVSLHAELIQLTTDTMTTRVIATMSGTCKHYKEGQGEGNARKDSTCMQATIVVLHNSLSNSHMSTNIMRSVS